MKRISGNWMAVLLIVLLSPTDLRVFAQGAQRAFTVNNSASTEHSYTDIALSATTKDKQVEFGVEEIIKASREKGMRITETDNKSKNSSTITVNVLTDSLPVVTTVSKNGLRSPEYMGWQCYSTRIRKAEKDLEIWILSTDKTGAMYGCLDIAEAIRNQTINDITDSDNRPYLKRRGIKFNIPLDLRSPSYSDHSDAFQQNIPVVWEMDFWKQQFDEMARHRYNVISLWNLNPFPSIVKVPEFPNVSLNDVWRTKKLKGESKQVQPYMLESYDIIKKISIDEKIAFWKRVMEYAKDRGIETYWFTWNIYPHGMAGKYGITGDQDNDTTIAYYRGAVRELVSTYPLLAGTGITLGEKMRKEGEKGKYTNEQWLRKTYGEGIDDALAKQPGRKFRLIHRITRAKLDEINFEFKNFAGTLDVSVKYSMAHMYSIPNPPFALDVINSLSDHQRAWLTVRNDDIFSFRWGNPSYARQYVTSIPHLEHVAGFYMGADNYCWGKDFLGRDSIQPRALIIQKQWYSFMLWGRLSYNPNLSDALFQKTLETRFPHVNPQTLINTWSAASMIFPWATRLSWGNIDTRWFPEGNYSTPDYKGFYTVKTLLEIEPMPGSKVQNILLWAQNYKENKPDTLLSPLAVADSLAKYARIAMVGLKNLPPRIPGSSREIDLTLGDIEAFALIGNYYAEKFRAACGVALYNVYGLQQDKDEAVQHLTNAKAFWIKYAELYDSKTKPALYNRVGYVNIPALTQETEKDIEIARSWVPGAIKEYKPKPLTDND